MKLNLGLGIAVGLLSFLNAGLAQAITLSFEPISQEVLLGNTVDVSIRISDLDDYALSAYDLTIAFDSNILQFNSSSFGNQLGDQVFTSYADLITLPNANYLVYRLNLYEISFQSPESLNENQENNFILAKLTFNTINLGTSYLKILEELPEAPLILGDANGDPFPLPPTLSEGTITVIDTTPVPEASTIPIPIIATVTWFLMKKYRKDKNTNK